MADGAGKTIAAPGEAPKKCCGCKGQGKKVKPSDLPLYGNPYPPKDIIHSDEPGQLESGFRATRLAIAPFVTMATEAIDKTRHFYETGVAHTKSTYDRISGEGNSVDKAVAITAGGLLGMILSARKGFFKKILYTGTGVGIMSAACFPKQTTELFEVSTYIAKKKGPELIKEYTGLDVAQYFPATGAAKNPEIKSITSSDSGK